MKDGKRCRPVSKSKTSDVKLVKDRLDVERRVSVHEHCSELDMGYGTVQRILIAEVNMSRVSARKVRRLMKDFEMERRVTDSKTFLRRFEKEEDTFLNRIITSDETTLFYYDPETKQQTGPWKSSDSPSKEGKNVLVNGKHMFIVVLTSKE